MDQTFMNKMSRYSSTLEITRGLFIALLGSLFIYLKMWGFSYPILTTLTGLLSLYFLLGSSPKTWIFTGAFTGLLWFWWVIVSFQHYQMLWAIPLGLLVIMLTYGVLFGAVAWIAQKISVRLNVYPALCSLLLKALGLWMMSFIHPFAFDWFKPELIFIESYLGIAKWQFGIILLTLVLIQWRRSLLFAPLLLLAYDPLLPAQPLPADTITLVTTRTTVEAKWDTLQHPAQFEALFGQIDQAIDHHQSLVILPESVFPLFLNRSQKLIDALHERAKKIAIIAGGLYWDGKQPRNASYIFADNHIVVANKVVLVPFGEYNPLPKFLSDWVNKVFYDGAIDYVASQKVIDFTIHEKQYRNAICFEATSEKLYEGTPKAMIVLSNNGWFVPSTEPILQQLLLQYYSKKYGTTIYHAINMSPSYTIINGVVYKE